MVGFLEFINKYIPFPKDSAELAAEKSFARPGRDRNGILNQEQL